MRRLYGVLAAVVIAIVLAVAVAATPSRHDHRAGTSTAVRETPGLIGAVPGQQGRAQAVTGQSSATAPHPLPRPAAVPSGQRPTEQPNVPSPAPPTSPASAGSGASGTATPPRQFTVLGAGDILLHSGLWAQARKDAATAHRNGYYFDPIFASAVPDIAGASLAICHMETPYGNPNGPFHGYPVFLVPPSIAQTIHDVGYDSCSTASNHSLDGGEVGIDRTLNALDAAGVKHTGTARTPAEAAIPDLLNANGVTVAQLSYAFGFNGLQRPAGKDWLANLINVPKILADARAARAAGAQVVIVSLHFGTEYQSAPSDQQQQMAKALLDSPDVDLILGCHVHIVQPFQEINGKWVAYGMGNQVAHQPFSLPTQDGVMPRFTFTETSPGKFTITKAEAIPTFMYLGQQGGPWRLIDLPRELGNPNLSAARKRLYEASWQRTANVVMSRGGAQDGLTVVKPGTE